MPKHLLPAQAELEEMDRTYRAGGLQAMASPHIHYRDPNCPHEGCGHRMEWIDFQLELYGDPTGVYNPLVRAWWDGTGFAGRCSSCDGWILFTTLRMQAITEDQANQLPRLPDNWHAVAVFA